MQFFRTFEIFANHVSFTVTCKIFISEKCEAKQNLQSIFLASTICHFRQQQISCIYQSLLPWFSFCFLLIQLYIYMSLVFKLMKKNKSGEMKKKRKSSRLLILSGFFRKTQSIGDTSASEFLQELSNEITEDEKFNYCH